MNQFRMSFSVGLRVPLFRPRMWGGGGGGGGGRLRITLYLQWEEGGPVKTGGSMSGGGVEVTVHSLTLPLARQLLPCGGIP